MKDTGMEGAHAESGKLELGRRRSRGMFWMLT